MVPRTFQVPRSTPSFPAACLFFLFSAPACFGASIESLRSTPPGSPIASGVPPIEAFGPAEPLRNEPAAAPGDILDATVSHAPDGDSLLVEKDGKTLKVRLAEVDTPEYDQPYGEEAKAFTRERLTGRRVTIEVKAVDAYGRLVSVVRLPGGDTHNRALLRAGLAWWYRYYSDDESLRRLEREAREARRGLWADADPVPPWTHRRDRRRRGLLPLDPLEL